MARPERKGRAAGRVLLEPVVRLDDLNVVIVAEHLGGLAEQAHKHVDAQTGIGRQENRRPARQPFDLRGLPRVKSCCRDDNGHGFFRRCPEISQ